MASTMRDLLLLLAGFTLGMIGSVIANFITSWIVYSVAMSNAIVALSPHLSGLRDKTLDGDWTVTWHVQSPNYPPQNIAKTRINSLLSYLAFEADFTGQGAPVTYRFVGRNRGGVISGRWFDPRSEEAYHGHFQLVRAGDLDSAQGKWIGFSRSGGVNADTISLTR